VVAIFLSGQGAIFDPAQVLPHESTEANRIKETFRGLYYERDAEPSQRAPL
jgi:hypothetical protein